MNKISRLNERFKVLKPKIEAHNKAVHQKYYKALRRSAVRGNIAGASAGVDTAIGNLILRKRLRVRQRKA